MKTQLIGVLAAASIATFLVVGCTASLPPEERTDDGLVRVPSRASGGVYRNLEADLTRYKRLMIEPMTVEFVKEWRKNHPEVSDAEVRRIQDDAVKMFREEFIEVLVDEGPFELAEVREPDVFIVVPRMLDLDVPAPEGGSDPGTRHYSPRPVAMQMTGELRDAVNGAILLRVIMFDGTTRYGFNEMRLANRVTNTHEIRGSLSKWSQLVREAIDVAKATKPR